MKIEKRNIVIALMVAMFLGAVEGTVVTTAVPTIAKDLKGFDLISWVFSLYLLTSAICTPIYGKLADLYGRKNTLSVGIVIFLIGSCLCGLSQSMYQLILFRAIQGIGAGSIFTLTYTIVGDIFTLEERARVQGWLSTVWGIASLMGPFLGGFLIDNLSWNWIFYINLPFGIISIILLQKYLNEEFVKEKHKIDLLGTLLLSVAIAVLLYGFLVGENNRFGYVKTVLLCFIICIIILYMFYKVEKKAEEPIIPFEIFTKSSTNINILSFLASAVLIGVDVYMPIYIQNVLGYKAMISGLSLAPMSIAWFSSSFILAKSIPRHGERKVMLASVLIMVIGCILLPTLGISSSLYILIMYVTLMGFGFGGCFTTLTIVVQASVDYDKRGVVTSTNSLVRTLGQTIGVSVYGGLFNMMVDSTHSKSSIISGVHLVFFIMISMSVIILVLSVMVPNSMKKK